MNSNNNLDSALEIIFRDSTNLGFWDTENKWISEKLINDKKWNWKSIKSDSHRYGLFTLSMICYRRIFTISIQINMMKKSLILFTGHTTI